MDKIHELDRKVWISKRRIKLKELIKERDALLQSHNVQLTESDNQGLNDNERTLLKELDKFSKGNEKSVKSFFLFNTVDERTLVHEPQCELTSYQLQYNHAKKMISDRAYKINYLMKLTTTRKELLMRQLALENRIRTTSNTLSTTGDEIDQVNLESGTSESNPDALSIDCIVVIQMWPQPSKSNKLRMEKEILFKANQCLTDLRDQFKCQRDYGVPMDLSANPEQAERIFRGEIFKSGFFLIGDTFYNDMRDKNNTDLSASIIEWASKEVTIVGEDGKNAKVKRGIGPFQRARMEETKFEDLEFQIGCPYLYLHQGDCEHLFTISDIHYVPNDLNLKGTKFPFVTASSIGCKTDYLRCYMCKNRPPHWYTRNNIRLPVDPFFFCEICFYSFNYDAEKKKIGDFQAFLYTSTFGIPDSVVIAESTSASRA